jgi:hypothetical protein
VVLGGVVPGLRTGGPGVATVAEANADTVSFIGVAALSDTPDMQEFIDRTGINSFANIADTESSVWQHFEVTAQPAYAFISPDGTVDTVMSSLTEDTLTTACNSSSNHNRMTEQ